MSKKEKEIEKEGLQEIRERLKIPRSQVEKDLFVRGQALFKWEKGLSKVPVEMAILLAKYYCRRVNEIDWNKKGECNEKILNGRINKSGKHSNGKSGKKTKNIGKHSKTSKG